MNALRNFQILDTPENNAPASAGELPAREREARRLWLDGKSENTARAYMTALAVFSAATGSESISACCETYEAGSDALRAFDAHLRAAGGSIRTRNARRSAIRSLLKLCEKERVLSQPLAHLLRDEKINAEDAIEEAEARAESLPDLETCLECIASEPDRRNRLILQVFFYTGVRVGELATAKRRHLKALPDGTAKLTVIGKGDKVRRVRLRAELYGRLRAFMRTTPEHETLFGISADRLSDICQRAWRRIGVLEDPRGAQAHLWRHCHLTYISVGGATDQQLQDSAGHTRYSTTAENYLDASIPENTGALLPWP